MFLKVARASVVTGLCLIVIPCSGCAEPGAGGFLGVSGPYLGQELPGEIPVLFAPGIVSTNTRDWSMASTPDGRELFFGISDDEIAFILHTKEVDGQWTEPTVASFSGQYSDLDLTMSPDGNRVYFTSDRPVDGTGPALEATDIWYVDRVDDGWGEPVRFPVPVNTQMRELYPSESRDGYVYFFSSRPAGFGKSDLYRVPLRKGEFGAPENLGPSINTEDNESDACISPDGDYLVFTSGRESGYGKGDLYVSFRIAEAGWTEAVNLGDAVNTEHTEFCPSVSRDGKYLFFTSNRPKPEVIE
ncbi:MAG: Xaa-Pro aminopeptidase, partial [bacterium]|nr:Xaa-Pro aminopeptidase [bacterium]